MLVSELLALATQVTFVLVALVTLLNYLRHRDASRLDKALLFCSLALLIVIQWVSAAFPLPESWAFWFGKLSQLVLMAHPYLLLRLVYHFRPVPHMVHHLALGGLVVSWIALLILPPPLPLPVTLLLVAYFVAVEGYAALAFLAGARNTRSVNRYRLFAAAASSGFLGLLILLVGAAIVAQLNIGLLAQLCALLAGVGYYVAFTPPFWLRRVWQLSVLYPFLQHTLEFDIREERLAVLQHLCKTAADVVGGMVAVAAFWEGDKGQLVVHASSHPFRIAPHSVLGAALTKVVTEKPGVWLAEIPADEPPESVPMASSIGAGAVLAVPLSTQSYPRGLLIVYSWRLPLFAVDDLGLLALLAEQTGVVLSYLSLLSQQQRLIRQLHLRTEQLQVANKELESFSYSVSHDLRAPLRHIVGYTELLQKRVAGTLDEKGSRYLQIILDSAGRMGNLIDELLLSSRLGRTEMRKTQVDLDSMVHIVIEELTAQLDGRVVKWQIADLPTVEADPTLLRVVMQNLLENALKFTRPRVEAEVSVGVIPGQDEMTIFVRDNGVGFDMNYAHQLFGVFHRLHSGTEFEGNGIGLANVRRIIQRHGGRTWAEGKVDEGATFYLTLPHKPATQTAGENSHQDESVMVKPLAGGTRTAQP